MNILVMSIPFALFMIYEINLINWHIKIFHSFFMLGCLFIAAETIGIIRNHWPSDSINYFFFILTVLCLGLLFYALFFALSFSSTYLKIAKEPCLNKTGIYAMCRHPGFLCFVAFYSFLSLTFPSRQLTFFSFVVCVLNFLYIVFQDLWSFPKLFREYWEYKKETPFIFPNKRSIQVGLQSFKNRGVSCE